MCTLHSYLLLSLYASVRLCNTDPWTHAALEQDYASGKHMFVILATGLGSQTSARSSKRTAVAIPILRATVLLSGCLHDRSLQRIITVQLFPGGEFCLVILRT